MKLVEGKRYTIQFLDFTKPSASYYGSGIYTGNIEEDSDEPDLNKGFLYEFCNLENRPSNELAYFNLEDIFII
jgi:hypothetical protein